MGEGNRSLLKRIKFERDSAVPFYQQLKDGLAEAIADRALEPGFRLPSEREFCEHLGISRLTVRRALSDLTNAGWLFSQPGKGTFVRDPKLEQGIHQLMGLTEDMKRKGHTVTSQVLRATVLQGSGKTAKIMQLSPKHDVVLLERLRRVDGEPLAIERSYLNHRLCPGILDYDLSSSLYKILRQDYGLRIVRAEQTYEALVASARESRLLDLPKHAPVLCSERTTFLDTGEVVERGTAWYRGDRYKFHTTLLDTAVNTGDYFQSVPGGFYSPGVSAIRKF